MSAVAHGLSRDYPAALPVFADVTKQLAYYADLNADHLGDTKPYNEKDDIEETGNALQALREIRKRKKFSILQYDRLPKKSALPEFLANLIVPLARLCGMSHALHRRVAPDFYAYLNDAEFAEKVRERVRAPLCAMLDRGDDILVLSHGTGSVVTYDVLWQLSHEPAYTEAVGEDRIRYWITAGSPLGDSSIQKHLLGVRKGETTFPSVIENWRNVAAEDDYMCHDNTLADDFCRMIDNKHVKCVKDYKIYNLAVRRGRSNPHSSVGYHIHPRVSKIVAEWLGVR
ncbi:MAG: hypothetical protein AAF351_15325 [Pseudomonadota bacterium]